MKFWCYLVLLSVVLLVSCKQNPKKHISLIGTWVSHDCILKINDTTGKKTDSALFDVNTILNCSINKKGDSILIKREYRFEQNIETNTYKYGFKILNQTDSVLNLKLVSGNASIVSLKKDSAIQFIRDKYMKDETIKLEKIIFLSSGGYGSVSWLNMVIDSNKEIRYEANFDDKNRSGIFKGLLNDSFYKELINILQTCDLRNLSANNIVEFDAGNQIIIAYFNHQRKGILYFQPPVILNKLVNFLNKVYKIADIHSTKEKIEIEGAYSEIRDISRPK